MYVQYGRTDELNYVCHIDWAYFLDPVLLKLGFRSRLHSIVSINHSNSLTKVLAHLINSELIYSFVFLRATALLDLAWVVKNTSTMLTKIPPQWCQKYLHNVDKNTSTMVTKIPPQLRKNQKKWWNINKQLHTLEKNFFYKSCFFLYEYYRINV